MKEYLLVSIVAVTLVLLLDQLCQTKLSRRKSFWILQGIVFVLASVVDNIISGRPYVYFNPEFIVGLRVVFVPIENYLFGFSMITLNLILFELGKKKNL
ncbi:lycopene cyclase domain-containing protein [Candidatus Woesebacteria bacterium]|nr:lycopene cyclase domain-containing protein [Candidatus Woesebacteria bacterium]